jgi:hypothetical protein
MDNFNATVINQLLVPFPRHGDRVFRVVDTDRFAKPCEECETLEGSTATAPDVENSRVLSNLDLCKTPACQTGMPEVHTANKESAKPSARFSTLREQSAKQVQLSSPPSPSSDRL